MACVGLTVCTLLVLLVQCMGQGLEPNRQAALGASNAQSRLESVYKNAKAWRASYRNAVSACSRNQGSLCAASGLSTDQKAQLLMATSPQAFDARSSSQMGGFSAVGQVKDQKDCNTCVSFSVLAAAQSAMACALRRDASSSLSEQDFFFCKSVAAREERTCSSSWNMESGIEALVSIVDSGKFPTTEFCLQYNPDKTDCDYNCQDTDSEIKKGHFKYVSRMQNIWQVQEHIRTWGSVVTRLDVYDDFRPFFKKNPSGIYPGPGPTAKLVESHAIQLVGYDMDGDPPYWIAKNSWGTQFGAGGFFKIAFGKAGVCAPEDTYGLKFVLDTPPPKPYSKLTPSTSRKGCFNYRGQPSDYISRVAATFGLPLQQVLYDNREVVQEPDMFLGGINLVLCGVIIPANGGGSTAAIPPPANITTSTSKPTSQQQAATGQQSDTPAADAAGGDASGSGGDSAYTGPLYYLVIGTYKGSVTCDTNKGTATAVLQRDDKRNVGQVKMDNTLVLNGKCTYKSTLACNSVRDGSGTWCGDNEEPWSCDVEETTQWDNTCNGQALDKATKLQMCYSSNSLSFKALTPTCTSGSGSVNLQ